MTVWQPPPQNIATLSLLATRRPLNLPAANPSPSRTLKTGTPFLNSKFRNLCVVLINVYNSKFEIRNPPQFPPSQGGPGGIRIVPFCFFSEQFNSSLLKGVREDLR